MCCIGYRGPQFDRFDEGVPTTLRHRAFDCDTVKFLSLVGTRNDNFARDENEPQNSVVSLFYSTMLSWLDQASGLSMLYVSPGDVA